MQIESQDYIFGPVPSHRLGRSLGIDPFGTPANKTCTLDCIFCEVGGTRFLTEEPFAGPNPLELAQAVEDYLAANHAPNFITVSGSGEPTLWQGLESFLRRLQQSVTVKLAVITNSTTLERDSVRRALSFAHVILPTLSTVDEETFSRIHAPLFGITAQLCASGIRRLRQEVDAEIWLEVLLLRGINDDKRGLQALANAIREINPHKVQVTTLTRPGRLAELVALGQDDIEQARSILAESGIPTEMAAPCKSTAKPMPTEIAAACETTTNSMPTEIAAPCETTAKTVSIGEEQIARIRAMLKLRWVSLTELAAQLGMDEEQLESELIRWFGTEALQRSSQDGVNFVRLRLKSSE